MVKAVEVRIPLLLPPLPTYVCVELIVSLSKIVCLCSWGLLTFFKNQSVLRQAALARFGSTHCESGTQQHPQLQDLTAATPTQVQEAQQQNPRSARQAMTLSKQFCQTCLSQIYGTHKPSQACLESMAPALIPQKRQPSPIICARITQAARAYCPATQMISVLSIVGPAQAMNTWSRRILSTVPLVLS